MNNKVAKVLITSQAQNLGRLFDYEIPEVFQKSIQIGIRVLVPFQNRPNIGIVWELADSSNFKSLKAISQLLDDSSLISSIHLSLIDWLAEYYFCSRSDVVKLCLPPGDNLSREVFYQSAIDMQTLEVKLNRAFSIEEVQEVIQLIMEGIEQEWSHSLWCKKLKAFPQIWDFLIQNHLLKRSYRIAKPKVKAKFCKLYRWSRTEIEEQSATGRRVRKTLLEEPSGLTAAQLCAAAEVSSSVLKRLLSEGLIDCFEVAAERNPAGFEQQIATKEIRLSPEQQEIYQKICGETATPFFLLHGVTGSGKTEIYFEMASDVIQRGGQVLYLVPEIALTPQTLKRARDRFGEQVALLHSNMSDGERYDQWFRVKNGKAQFVLGARSAVFAPFDKLELMIIDEEHETTYKQEENPRYHIRKVVEKLAELTGAKVIFGSATPSVESFFYAQSGKYRYLPLTKRFNRNPLPEVTMVDMRQEIKDGNKNVLSRQLFAAIHESLEQHEQIILLLNRRGYSTFILCRDCGQSLRCPACDVALTYHLNEKNLRCHYCDYRQPVPDICPNCQSSRIRYFGHGTQKLEEELALNFPSAHILRMDVDSTSRKGAHQQIYQQLVSGEIDILLGTQMIAKGLDLPKVTLVGVISADSTLNIPDFRAAERTFQLLTQVAGRAGRGEKLGKVIFQAYDSEHYSLRLAKEHDYLSFYQEEIKNRADLHYPPYIELVKIGFSGLNDSKVDAAAHEFYQIVKVIEQQLVLAGNPAYYIEVLGPGPTLIPKIQNNYRWQILLKSNQPSWLEKIVKEAWEQFNPQKHPDIKVIKDRNPYLVV
jgi:primosomal protein N' (replication factor Y) (superfamily II helicase)